ncbi:hypothetical protein [Methylocystis sp. ATCC 49242]|uniref:hypothetical protein n=1 Tax=Methylocystis sp. ATCC 49242 TaxID=622637 RepID=UPI0001F885FE|nr:hypothetical protein [Methylocystis sp. ATCC 49242]
MTRNAIELTNLAIDLQPQEPDDYWERLLHLLDEGDVIGDMRQLQTEVFQEKIRRFEGTSNVRKEGRRRS